MISGNLMGLNQERGSLADSGRRTRLTTTTTVLGCMLGAATILVSVITQTDPFQQARHLSVLPSAFFSAAGVLSALIITPLTIYHVRDNASRVGTPQTWIGLGLGFGIAHSFIAGALLPLTLTLLSLTEGSAGQASIASQVIDAVFGGIRAFFIQGAIIVSTGLLAGMFFGIGGFVIDKLNSRESPYLSRIGPWVVSIVLGISVLGFCMYGPPEFLRSFGG